MSTFTVTDPSDAGPNTLRGILNNGALANGDTILFSVSSPITVTSGSLVVGKSVTLQGPVAVQGNNTSTVFVVNAGVTANFTSLTISGGNGNSTGMNGTFNVGGGIFNQGTLTLQNTTLTGNQARRGGGVYTDQHSTLTVLYSTIDSNQTTSISGAGIYGYAYSTLRVRHSTITRNSAIKGGGGISFSGTTLDVENSVISGNSALGGQGGGIADYYPAFLPQTATILSSTLAGNYSAGEGGGLYFAANTLSIQYSTITANTALLDGAGISAKSFPATVVISNSTISNNVLNLNSLGAVGFGAGIFNSVGTMTIQNSTISGNHDVISNGGSGAFGGGIYDIGSVLTLQNSTISNNSLTGSPSLGGGIAALSGTPDLESTLVSGNTASVGPDIFGTANASFSLIGDSSGATIMTGSGPNIVDQPALLGPLQDNGGPTFTMALLPGSPGIDAGSNPANLSSDQRGSPFVRTSGGGTDIGAFEIQPYSTSTVLVSSTNPASLGQAITFTATVSAADGVNGPPNGTVNFFDGSTLLGSGVLSNGVATFTTSALTAGTHNITAVFVGNANFLASTSNVVSQVVNAPAPPPAATGIITVGSDAGLTAEVKVYDATTNALKFDLLPFNGFTGGVRVAVGDVNHDGTPDIIVGAGPGGGPQVRVYDGRTGQPLPGLLGSFFGLAAGFTGGVFVAAGDVNGDGFADVIVGADKGGGPQVTVYSGKDGSILVSFYGLASAFTGGVRVAAGDVDADGRSDIIIGAGPGGGPQVTAYRGSDLSILSSFYALPANFKGGVYVAAGDLNGDGKADIVVGAGAGGLPQVTVFSGNNGAILASFYDPRQGGIANVQFATVLPGVRVGTAVVNGRAELLTAPGPGLPVLVDVFSGQTRALLDSFFAFDPAFLGGGFVGG